MQQYKLPPTVHFIERDWLSANHVVLLDEGEATLIDSGYLTTTETTWQTLQAVLAGRGLKRIVNTHLHSDHVGGNAFLQRWTGCELWLPVDALPVVARWDGRELWLDYADQICEPFRATRGIKAGEVHRWGGLDWLAIAAPGHDDTTLLFYNEREQILISADALWEQGFGFILPQTWDAGAVVRTRATLDMLASLKVRTVIPGHGPVFHDYAKALANANTRLTALAASDERIARSMAKPLFLYSLMWRGEFLLADLPRYVASVGVLQALNTQFLKLSNAALVTWLCQEAVASGHAVLTETALQRRLPLR
jgi:glyoxylase-like metal-dependent hydrolase (beta-lactamase superfamily II)